MNAEQLQAEQSLVTTMERDTMTIQRLIVQRDAFRDALAKIAAIRFQGLTFEQKADRAVEIAEKTLNSKT